MLALAPSPLNCPDHYLCLLDPARAGRSLGDDDGG